MVESGYTDKLGVEGGGGAKGVCFFPNTVWGGVVPISWFSPVYFGLLNQYW